MLLDLLLLGGRPRDGALSEQCFNFNGQGRGTQIAGSAGRGKSKTPQTGGKVSLENHLDLEFTVGIERFLKSQHQLMRFTFPPRSRPTSRSVTVEDIFRVSVAAANADLPETVRTGIEFSGLTADRGNNFTEEKTPLRPS